MKKFILYTFLFLLPVIICFILLEWTVRHIPSSYAYKAELIKQNSNGAQVLILGSSLAYCHINPDSLSLPAINLANSAQPLNYDKFLFDRYAGDMSKLEYVILPITYFTFATDLEAYIGVGRDVYYAQFLKYPYPLKPEYYFQSWNIREVFRRMKLYYIDHKEDIEFDCRPNGFCALSVERRLAAGKDWDNGTKVATGYRKLNDRYMAQRTADCARTIEQMANQCAERGISMILYTPPVTRKFRHAMDSTQWNTILQTTHQIVAAHPNVSYYDFIDNKEFSDDDFKDADHLLESGANKLTRLINTILTQ